MKRIILIMCLSLLWSGVAFGAVNFNGKYILPDFDYEKAKVRLKIYDNVNEGCLPNPASLKDAYEVELRRLGFGITEVPDVANGMPSIDLTFNGFALGSGERKTGCAVRYDISMHIWREVTIGDGLKKMPLTVWTFGGIRTSGSGQQMQSALQENAKEAVNDLYLSIMRLQESK